MFLSVNNFVQQPHYRLGRKTENIIFNNVFCFNCKSIVEDIIDWEENINNVIKIQITLFSILFLF